MRRRLTWILACAIFAIGAGAATAQQTRKVAHVGYLAAVSAAADAPRLEAFRQGLRDHGYFEGQNLILDLRHEGRSLDRLPALADELVASKVDVLVAVTSNAAVAASRATSTIPIVFMGVTDPVAAGLIDGLARPGRNATGVTNIAAILTPKRLQFLKSVVPGLERVAVLWDPRAPGSVPQWQESQQAARDLGLQLYSMEVGSPDRYDAAFAIAVVARNTAVWVTLNPVANSNQKLIAELAIKHGLPSICARSDYVDYGCLLSYGPGYSNEGRDGARFVDRILKGARPADLPVEQPTTFELVINQKTARELGVPLPPSVLFQADRVVE